MKFLFSGVWFFIKLIFFNVFFFITFIIKTAPLSIKLLLILCVIFTQLFISINNFNNNKQREIALKNSNHSTVGLDVFGSQPIMIDKKNVNDVVAKLDGIAINQLEQQDVWLNLALINFQLRNCELAQNNLSKAEQINPNNPEFIRVKNQVVCK